MVPKRDYHTTKDGERQFMADKKIFRFKIGDWIIHHFHGIGKVQSIEDKALDGEKHTFYKVKTKDIAYWIPVDQENRDHLEPIRSSDEFEHAIMTISQPPQDFSDHPQTRKKQIQERWQDGHLLSRAELIRDLNGRMNLERLNFDEKEIFDKALQAFVGEWIVVDQSLTHAKATTRVCQALEVSTQHIKM